jgi:hypothetical protein
MRGKDVNQWAESVQLEPVEAVDDKAVIKRLESQTCEVKTLGTTRIWACMDVKALLWASERS